MGFSRGARVWFSLECDWITERKWQEGWAGEEGRACAAWSLGPEAPVSRDVEATEGLARGRHSQADGGMGRGRRREAGEQAHEQARWGRLRTEGIPPTGPGLRLGVQGSRRGASPD